MEVKENSSLTYLFSEKIINSSSKNSREAMTMAAYGLIDYIGACFAGCRDSGVLKLISIFKEEGGKECVPIIGNKLKVSRAQGALINGFIGHILDFDDVHSEVRGHPSTVILPTLISISANTDITGEKFLEAYVIGVEVMARLGNAIGSNHFVRGWHNTSTLGVIAATVAGGYIKGFTVEKMAKAIGFAATQASGLRVQFGTETKPLHPGLAAQAAIRSINFVEANISGSSSAFDGELGFFEIYGEGNEFAKTFLLDNWEASWKILKPGLWFKIYPFCSAAHHGAEAASILSSKNNIDPSEIEDITVKFPPNGDAALIKLNPKTGEEGRFSIEYIVALVLGRYELSFANFKDLPISDDVKSLMTKIKREHDSSIIPAENSVPYGRFTIVEINTLDGRHYEARVDCPKGSPENPLTLSELEMKLKQSVEDEKLSKRLLEEIMNLRKADNLNKLLELL